MINLENFNYFLPPELIANQPASPRDHSRLLIYDTQKDQIDFDYFYHLPRYLPADSFLVMNDTRVVPARITLYKKNGGKVRILFLINEIPNYLLPTTSYYIRGYADRKITIGDKLYFNKYRSIDTSKQEGNIFTFQVNFPYQEFICLLGRHGTMPIPLYIKKTPLDERVLRRKYQTIFADRLGSAAAPTAALHFTRRLFKKLDQKGIKRYFLTLHVGLGTFAPISDRNIKEKRLHEEYYEISPDMFRCIDRLKQEGKKLVAVGTTVTRTLETFGKSKIQNHKSKIFGKTNLFIFPPYHFKMVDALITNFHLPKSSLTMLVEAFLQQKRAKRHLIDIYETAVKNRFRFYSFGDAMIIT